MGEIMNDVAIDAGLHLTIHDYLPEPLLDVPATEIWQHLEGPTLFHIAGRQEPPLFVSVLLHGNEHTGWTALQEILRQHRRRPLPRSLLLFVGNIAAARADVRSLAEQTDYNRVWPGTAFPTAPEAALMRRVFASVQTYAPFAAIDIHNNTGNNPHYACVTRLDEHTLNLARLFGGTVVYFEKPVGVQTGALASLCPAVTVECGRSGDVAGVEHIVEFVTSALTLSEWPHQPVPEGDLDLMRTYAILKVPPEASISFDGSKADLRFRPDLDHLNFSELEPGTVFGRLGTGSAHRMLVVPGGDVPVTQDIFDYAKGEIRLTRRAIPAMLTRDAAAVRFDSLGYLMHRIDRRGARQD
jgi:hypothetical protein